MGILKGFWEELTTEWKEDLEALRYQEEVEGPTKGERMAAKIALSILGLIFLVGFLASRY